MKKRDDDTLDLLPPNFEPSEWDVICQRGKECFEHVGNRRFRETIDRNLDRYLQVRSRREKSIIVSEIVGTIRSVSNAMMSLSGGGFVRKDLLTRQWYRVGDKVAREKAGQALRDAIKTRRATERKRVQDDPSDERCSYPQVWPEQSQHTFHSEPDDDGSSSIIKNGVKKRRHEAFEMTAPNQYAVLAPSRIHSNDVLVSFSGVSNDDRSILGSNEVLHHGRPLIHPYSNTKFATPDSLCSNVATVNQHDQRDPFLRSILPGNASSSSKHVESQFLSGDLEPRPMSSAVRSENKYTNKTPAMSGGVPPMLVEHPASDRIGSMIMEYRNKNENPTILVRESVTVLDEQKHRLFAPQHQETRSEEPAAAARHLLTQLLQPETGNDISSYNKHFFVFSTNHDWHSSHMDELGFCCDIVGSERPTMEQLSGLAGLDEEECSCVGYAGVMDDMSTFAVMDHHHTTDQTMHNQGHPLMVKYSSQAPQSLLQQGPPSSQQEQQPFLPSRFGSDQFLTMGHSRGMDDAGSGYSRICYPDITKSNIPLIAASTLRRDTKDCEKEG